ncbi:MAG: SDR family oxidoreductase, partial [Neisseriaceae bacterium]|nr:SDR family oxidoreductase [Neisseriaceae bacterium]
NVMGLAKASLEASIRYTAAAVGRSGIRCNGISAGPVKTIAASGITGEITYVDCGYSVNALSAEGA